MARLWHTGFEANSTTAWVEFSGGVTGTASIVTTNPNKINGGGGAYSLRTNNSSQTGYITHAYKTSPNSNAAYVRFYIYIATAPSAATRLLSFGTAGTGSGIRLNTDRTLTLMKEDNTTLGSNSAAIPLNEWHMIEMQTASSATIIGRLDGVQFASGTNSAIGSWSTVNVGNQTSNTTDLYFDDIALDDAAFPGAGTIVHLLPTAAGDNNTLLKSGGGAGDTSNWSAASERTPDDATSYNKIVATADNGKWDAYKVTSPSVAGINPGSTINVVSWRGRWYMGNSNTWSAFVARIRLSGTNTDSSSQQADTASAWRTFTQSSSSTTTANGCEIIMTTTAPGGGAWNVGQLDSVQVGIVLNENTFNSDNRVSSMYLMVDFVNALAQGGLVTVRPPNRWVGPQALRMMNHRPDPWTPNQFQAYSQDVTAGLSFTGAFTAKNIFLKALTAGLSFAGAISKLPKKVFNATLNLTGGQTGYQTPTLLQSGSFHGASTTSNVVTLGSNITAGSLLVAMVINEGNSGSGTVAGGGGSFTGAGEQSFTGVARAQFFYRLNATGGTNTVTWTLPTPVGSNSVIVVQEWSGIASFEGGSQNVQGSTTTPSINYTNTQSNDLLIGAFGNQVAGVSFAPDTGWTNETEDNNAGTDPDISIFSKYVTGTGSNTASGVNSATAQTAENLYAFRAATFVIASLQLKVIKLMSASLGFAGAFIKTARKALSGTLSFLGGFSTGGHFNYLLDLAASLGFVGNLTKRTSTSRTAGLSFTGNFVKTLRRTLSATLSFTGAMSSVRGYYRSFTAALGFTGAFSKQTNKQHTAGLSFTGSLLKFISKPLTATLSFVGAIIRAQKKTLTAILSFTGSVVKQTTKPTTGTLSFTGAFSTSNVFKKALTATLSFTGNIQRNIFKQMTAGLSFVGALRRAISTKLTAGLSFTGNFVKRTTQAYIGSLSFTGALSTSNVFKKALTAALSFTGAIKRDVRKQFTAGLSFTGNLVKRLGRAAFTAALSFTGAVVKRTNNRQTGSLSFTGSLNKRLARILTAALSFTGAIRKFTSKRLATGAGLSFTGVLTKSRNLFFTAALSFTGTITKLAKINLFGGLSFSGFWSQYIAPRFVPLGVIIQSFTNRGTQSSSTNLADVETGDTISDVQSSSRDAIAKSQRNTGELKSDTNEKTLEG